MDVTTEYSAMLVNRSWWLHTHTCEWFVSVTYEYIYEYIWIYMDESCHVRMTLRTCMSYGVATMSRLLKIMGLFCKRALQNRRYSAKETYNFKEPTNRSHLTHYVHTWVSFDRLWMGHDYYIWILVNGSWWVMSHIWMSHVTHTNESCHTYEWVMSHIRMSHVTHMNESWYTYEWVMSHIRMSHVTHTNESCHTYEW